MQRTTVQVARIRIRDLRPGDIVNKDPDSMSGWFEMVELRRLHDGSVAVAGRTPKESFSAQLIDICGIQVLQPTEFLVPEQQPPASTAPLPPVAPTLDAPPAIHAAATSTAPATTTPPATSPLPIEVPDSIPERWSPPQASSPEPAAAGGPGDTASRALA